MASLNKDKKGWRILFFSPDGVRRTIRLTRYSKPQASQILRHVEELVNSNAAAHPASRQTAVWLNEIGGTLYDKLSHVGLVPKRTQCTLGAFLSEYIDRRTDVKPGTRLNYDQVRINLLAFFGSDKPLRSITTEDGVAFRRWLQTDEGLGENTLRRRCGRARQFFTAAIQDRLIESNPFAGIPVTVSGNKEKERFITEEEAKNILQACPNAEWRLIFSLCRYGGLRCPSEVLLLKWGDILWHLNRFIVTSPKTEHHKGHDSRVVPLFPELFGPLQDVKQGTPDDNEFVITRYRSKNSNLRTELNRIVKRAGILPWPKPFQNLRSTRETELMETYPPHVVCGWIGNSEAVAKKHYLQITDAHFEKATKCSVAQPVAH